LPPNERNDNAGGMDIYLINLDRRTDRLAAMTAEAGRAGLSLIRLAALDAADPEDAARAGWFAASGPLGPLPRGDRCCTLSHRLAWQALVESGASHAVVLEDDVRLSAGAGALLQSSDWIPDDVDLLKLEHYGPRGQRILVTQERALLSPSSMASSFSMARLSSRHTGAAAYLLSKRAAQRLLEVRTFNLPVDHLLFNPNNSSLFASLKPWQLIPAIARQQQFVGAKSDIEGTRIGLRKLSSAYVKRELIRFGYDLKLVPRQLMLLTSGKARFIAIGTQT
jgi:glycosyl transferase family 25